MAERAQSGKDLLTLYKALFIELPVAGSKATLGVAKDYEVEEAAWKAYEAWVRLVNNATDALYQNPFFGDALGRNLHGLLRVQLLANSVSGALSAALRSVAGLPGVSELQAVRTEVHDLRSELRGLIAAVPNALSMRPEQADMQRDEEAEEGFIHALDGRLEVAGGSNNGWVKAA
jgi:hypothetical protein